MARDFRETAHLRTKQADYNEGWERVFGKKNFIVTCDETNNTKEDIANNVLDVDILIGPKFGEEAIAEVAENMHKVLQEEVKDMIVPACAMWIEADEAIKPFIEGGMDKSNQSAFFDGYRACYLKHVKEK